MTGVQTCALPIFSQVPFINLKDDKGEIKLDRDFLKEEVHKLKENRKKMQSVICDLLGQGFANTDDLLMIKVILEE